MIKDTLFKSLSIPILGVLIPLISNLISYRQFSWLEIIISNLLFITTSYIVWQGAVVIVSRVRKSILVKKKIYVKLIMLCLTTAVYGFFLSMFSGYIWQNLFLSVVNEKPVITCAIICAGIVVLLTLVYEVLFLSKERELDMKIVDQLDKERIDAEMNALKNELDPHFIFNSLSTLSHLISTDTDKAQLFTQKLAQVYKYLLINKDREMISLNDEIKFIDDYFFLLRIRYDEKLQLSLNIGDYGDKAMILPCSLQMLVENAIKHNLFTEREPLLINITMNGEYLKVENNVRTKLSSVDSTKIGLYNLSNRYRLLYNKDIVIDKTDHSFTVKLPLIKQSSL